MKRSSLTKRQRDLLEELLARHGVVVTSAQVAAALPHQAAQSVRRLIALLLAEGWLVRIKAGLYQIADISSLGSLTLSRLTIAHLLLSESYVSFRTALQFHGFYDQGLKSVGSVALRQRPEVTLEGTRYYFIKTTPTAYFGFAQHALDGHAVKVASAEKALLDMLRFNRSSVSVDIVLEVLTTQAHNLDVARLVTYAKRLPVAVQQVAGYLLELSSLPESEQLLEATRVGHGASKLTPESTTYNHRWRLYIDPYFTGITTNR